MSNVKVFAMDDCTWWAAESVEAAKADYLKETGMTDKEAFGGGEYPQELSELELVAAIFHESEFNSDDQDEWTFSDELYSRIKAGQTFPQFFASTEY